MDRTPAVTCRERDRPFPGNRRCRVRRSFRCRCADDRAKQQRRTWLLAGASRTRERSWFPRSLAARAVGRQRRGVGAARGARHPGEHRLPASLGEIWIPPRRTPTFVSLPWRSALRRVPLLASPWGLGLADNGGGGKRPKCFATSIPLPPLHTQGLLGGRGTDLSAARIARAHSSGD